MLTELAVPGTYECDRQVIISLYDCPQNRLAFFYIGCHGLLR